MIKRATAMEWFDRNKLGTISREREGNLVGWIGLYLVGLQQVGLARMDGLLWDYRVKVN